ncbi:MAG: GDSL-type esterase/lipase family protein [bacterium]
MRRSMFQIAAAVLCLNLLNVAYGAGESMPVNVAAFKGTNAIRVACIGDSITCGPYPSMVQNALGSRWDVKNLGVSGSTMLRNGDKAFNKLGQFAQAIAMKPDVVTIALGTNDSKPGNWNKKAEFEADYKAMIAELRKANAKVIIYCCLPPPAGGNKWSISGDVIKNEIIPMIRKLAKETKCYTIDLYESLEGKNGFSGRDQVHPNGEGHKLLAATIVRALTGKDMPAEAPKM